LALFTVAIVWGSTFAVQRVAAAHLGFFLYNGLRFLLGALALLPFVRRHGFRFSQAERRGGMLAGGILAAAAALQQAGLKYTSAGQAAFITGLYVVLVPLILALGWRELPHWSAWIASLTAVAGLFLLSAQGTFTLSLGDSLELAGAVAWATHVILIGKLAGRANPLRLSLVQYLVCGLLSTVLGLAFEFHTLGGLATSWWSVVYGGVLAVGLGFTLQVVGQKVAPPTDAAVILGLEIVFAAFFGWLFLGEVLSPRQMLGCGLMFAGMLLAQAPAFVRARASPPAAVLGPRRDRMEAEPP
jgi:drug/metabolite transporter (DMT)-like permease